MAEGERRHGHLVPGPRRRLSSRLGGEVPAHPSPPGPPVLFTLLHPLQVLEAHTQRRVPAPEPQAWVPALTAPHSVAPDSCHTP